MVSENPKFNIDQVVRIGDGTTALMKISSISPNHGGIGKHRYYGDHVMTGAVGSYEDKISNASEEDLKIWEKNNGE